MNRTSNVTLLHLLALLIVAGILCPRMQAQESSRILYAGNPNHRQMAVRAFRLAVMAGFHDDAVDTADIRDRLEAGAYSEDYESIPGEVGSHFPNPWDQGPQFSCQPLPAYPLQRIPYGPLADPSRRSGWYRGLSHGFDPINNFRWPGAEGTTIEWANDSANAFSWGNAISLYRQGRRLEAYQCLGHVLHLLMDLSVPAHVKVVNHGASLQSQHSGTWNDPDYAQTIIDEYETALSGGLNIPSQIEIPDLSGAFTGALFTATATNIPDSATLDGYFMALATSTYCDSLVQRYYAAPGAAGQFGSYKDANGQLVNPATYAECPASIDGRWTLMSLRGTAHPSPVISAADMGELCRRLVPGAVEHCAGLILLFSHQVVSGVNDKRLRIPGVCALGQNYPNPFNPTTEVGFWIGEGGFVTLKVYDLLGREVSTLVNQVKRPGTYTARWDATGMPSGVYYYQLGASGYVITKKLLLLR